ncbi:hypothetical protein AB6C82_23820 [Vibrio splendidus]
MLNFNNAEAMPEYQTYDVNLANIQTIANQAFLEWDKAESLYTKEVSMSGKTVQIESLTATAHQLP